jgi:hypothetical protein
VRNERSAYYGWLYAGDLELDGGGPGFFSDIHDGRFVERVARKGTSYERLPLHEAAYEPVAPGFTRFQEFRV